MIYSSIKCNTELPNYPTPIAKAISYLKETDFMVLETGIYEIEGKTIYAQLFDKETLPLDEALAESHKKFLDVQFLVKGREKIGVTNFNKNYQVQEYIEERDLIFYKAVENETFIEMNEGDFCIFFPDDIHRPAVVNGEKMIIRKVVVKIDIDTLK